MEEAEALELQVPELGAEVRAKSRRVALEVEVTVTPGKWRPGALELGWYWEVLGLVSAEDAAAQALEVSALQVLSRIDMEMNRR